jgi:glucokinase
MAVQSDETALRIFQNVGQALGIALANMINVLNLPMYVIGGGMANAWNMFAPGLLDQVQKRSFVYTATTTGDFVHVEKTAMARPQRRQATAIARASLGSDAGLLGAARLAMIADLSSPEPSPVSAGIGSGH